MEKPRSIFNEWLCYNQEGRDLEMEAYTLFRAVLQRCQAAGLNLREVGKLIADAVEMEAGEMILRENMAETKRRREEGQSE